MVLPTRRRVFKIKQGDRLPAFRVVLDNLDGTVEDLTGVTSVEFHFTLEDGSGSPTTGTATVITATAGLVEYAWAASDTDVVGVYRGEFEVVTAAAKRKTYPANGDSYFFEITDDIAD